MGKITVEHYLNEKLKPLFRKGALEYSVYLRVSYARRNERIKSRWIVHPCSENDFINDKHIVELKKYESEIINNIIDKVGANKFNLKARLSYSQMIIPDIFVSDMFDKHEIKNQIIDYISVKADINKSILNPYFNTELNYNEWRELYEKEIFCDITKDKVMYLSMLLEFEEIKYPPLADNIFGYRAGCIFIPHEWDYKNVEQEFIEFAKNKNILPRKKLEIITLEFNSILLEHSTSDIGFE